MMLLCHLIYVRTFNAEVLCIGGLLMLFPPLQHLSSASLKLSLISDQVRLERDLFLNLGSVQNLSLDISGTVLMSPNRTMAEVANPSTKYKVDIPNSVFLKDLVLGQKALPCTCHSVG